MNTKTTKTHRIINLSKTGLYPSGAVSLSSLCMLARTLDIFESNALIKMRAFKSNKKLNSACLMLPSVICLFSTSSLTVWFFLYIVSLLSVGVVFTEVDDRFVVSRIMTLSFSVSTLFWSACTSGASDSSSPSINSIGWQPPPGRYALCASSASISATFFRCFLFGLYGANIVPWDYVSYRLLIIPGLDSVSLLSAIFLFSELLFLLRITSIISRVGHQ